MLNSFLQRRAGLLAGGLLALASCKTPNPPAPANPDNSRFADTVQGNVLDTKGQPLAGVRVRAENDVTHSWAEVRTDAIGHYTFPKLEFGGWKIYAWHEVTYKGQPYTLRLGMPTAAGYDAFAPGSQGATRDFRWQLSGTIPDRPRTPGTSAGYFGGAIRLVNMDSNFTGMPVGTEVTVTLTPVAGATLFDGSAPQVIRKSFTVVPYTETHDNYWLYDIPQCEYRVTATSRLSGVAHSVGVSRSNIPPFQAALDGVYFKPAGGGSYESGLQGPQNDPIYVRWQ
ncbi:carboxypeptidase-like regulatory domain-containing protein [Hymenobacter ruricola]|uniref:Carboxypeptidase regulatory-like domain-containing protein n=1 Tax=Hymenobacter ruricola TaxID=2791023 RepID=A0ABS0HYR1_9BACT|nr:carboxypeptidase-like regulatory domain-containing protein [Hymenobacter ruricola]MBF9219835.1 carboxypeptidase regulatory-like domain-containing protein [Hymenobacter ruricola]